MPVEHFSGLRGLRALNKIGLPIYSPIHNQLSNADANRPCAATWGGSGGAVIEAHKRKGMFLPLPWGSTEPALMQRS